MRIRGFLIVLVSQLPTAEAQVVLRNVASDGMTVPGREGVTLDGFADISVAGTGEVLYTAGRRQNGSTIGNIAFYWVPGSPPFDLLGVNDAPPRLPVPTDDFRDSRGDPFDDPQVVEIVNIPRMQYTPILEVRYRNVGVSGTKIAYVGYSGMGPVFLRETGTTSRGYIDSTFEIVMTGLLFDPFTSRIGRAPAVWADFETVFQQGMEIPDLGEGEKLSTVPGAIWNDAGRFASLIGIEGSEPGVIVGSGLFLERRDRDGFVTIARSGERHPSYPGSGLAPEGVFENIGGFGAVPYTINNRGEVAFFATITDPDDPGGTVSSLWHQEDGPEIVAVVRTGTPVEVEGYGTTEFIVIGSPMIAENGDLVYRAEWKEGEEFLNGLLRWDRSAGSHHMLLKEGDALDGPQAGIVLDFVSSFDLMTAPDGRVAAMAGVRMPGGASRQAVIVQRATGVFHAAAIIGEILELTDGTNLGTLASATLPPNRSINGMDGKPYGFSPVGRIPLLIEDGSGIEHVIAIDVDAVPAFPKPEEAVAAGRAEAWSQPTGFDEGLSQEEDRLREKLAMAADSTAVDLGALTGLTATELARLSRSGRFSREPREFAIGYLNARLNVLTAIRLAALWDPKRAAWLMESFLGGRILFGEESGSATRAFAEIRADASAEGGTETITLRFLSAEALEIHDADLVQLANSLLHEARHAFQAFSPLDRIHTAEEQAAWAKGRHENELVASREEVALVEDLIAGLLGNDSGAFSRAVLESLNAGLEGSELEDARNRLMARLLKMRRNAQYTVACRDGYCQALQRFLDAGATEAAGGILLEELKLLKCFSLYRSSENEFGEIGVFGGEVRYNSVAGRLEATPTIRQFDTGSGLEASFEVGGGAELVYDAELSADGAKLYVGAKTGSVGTIFSYESPGPDSAYDASTEEVVVASVCLDGGFQLALDPAGKGLHAYALDSGMVYRVDEEAGLLEEVGQLMPSPDPVLDFELIEDFVKISPMPRFETPGPGFFYRLIGYGGSALGDELEDSGFGSLRFPPVFGKAPVEGDAEVLASGRPGAEVRLERGTSGGGFVHEADAVFDTDGLATLSLSSPLIPGQELRIGNATDEGFGEPMPVWPQAVLDEDLRALAASDRGLYLESRGTPEGDYSLEWGISPGEWGDPMPFRMGPFGTSVGTDETLDDRPDRYFGRLRFGE